MKIRTDFVTNSSSSSFIIARHSDLTEKEIDEVLEENSERIRSFLKDYNVWNNKKISFASAKKKIISKIQNQYANMKLGNWSLSCGEVSDEDGEFFESFLYHTDGINGKHLKIALE